jgi:hypothetical protein
VFALGVMELLYNTYEYVYRNIGHVLGVPLVKHGLLLLVLGTRI